MNDYREFIAYLSSLGYQCHIGLEATSNYHRPIAYHLQMAGQLKNGHYLYRPHGSHLAMYDDQKSYFEGLAKFLYDVDASH